MEIPARQIGPILFARGASPSVAHLAAVLVRPSDAPPPPLEPDGGPPVEANVIYQGFGHTGWRFEFELPVAPDAGYSLEGERYPVPGASPDEVRIAYVTGNGRADDPASPDDPARWRSWRRLRAVHEARPVHLLLHGGGQLHAQGMLAAHHRLRRWRTRRARPYNDEAFSADMRDAAEAFLLERYLTTYAAEDLRYLAARVPSLMMWDDHDILAGWGNLDEWRTYAPIGAGLFGLARTMFLLFQMGAPADAPPLGIAADRGSLTWAAHFPGFSVVALDLRSERLPGRMMGEGGRSALAAALADAGSAPRTFVMSSAPLLGPRLGGIETLVRYVPGGDRYREELDDAWRTRAHREEWSHLLEELRGQLRDQARSLTLLSAGTPGVAAHAVLELAPGRELHQLAAPPIGRPSASAHRARLCELVAVLDAVVPSRLSFHQRRLPGRTRRYAAERGFLALERAAGRWRARWELEGGGGEPYLDLGPA